MMKYLHYVSIFIFIIWFSFTVAARSGSEQVRLTAPEGNSYQWLYNGQLIGAQDSQQIIAAQSGTYTVLVSMNDGTVETKSYVVNATTGKVTVFVIGDSTASVYGSDLYPRTGWAQVLQPFFNSDNVVVNDQAASGRSSKSFYDEGKWNTVYNMLKAGDYVLIQFAHNDEKTTDPTRYTDPATTYRDYLKIFGNGAKEKGAYPVFISSIPRNNWSGTQIKQAHAAYTQAMKEVAAELEAPFIDMEASTMAFLNSRGKSYATDSIFNNLKSGVWQNYPDGNSDGTHLQQNGAFELCKVLVADLKQVTAFSEIQSLTSNLVPAIRINAMADPDLKGKVTGYGVYAKGTTVTLTASPVNGYRFVNWTLVNSTDVYSTEKSISLTTDTLSLDFRAHFELITALQEHKVEDIKVYPNPATNYVNVDVKAQRWQIDILDLSGRVMLSGQNIKSIDLRGVTSGTYLVHIKTSEQEDFLRFQIR
ncbi:T9SS type A sorting domain-containing protein [Saccharicrinis sp. FJH54]|uniref:T9SS type A sorting domain-containing protein n=1 Tax=Saccharicrinis sp. FJH54 TaxID=3344665 RepID=UPI0035D3F1EA